MKEEETQTDVEKLKQTYKFTFRDSTNIEACNTHLTSDLPQSVSYARFRLVS